VTLICNPFILPESELELLSRAEVALVPLCMSKVLPLRWLFGVSGSQDCLEVPSGLLLYRREIRLVFLQKTVFAGYFVLRMALVFRLLSFLRHLPESIFPS